MIRAKFRCLLTTCSWDNIHRAEFKPVYQKKDNGSDGNAEENKTFWEATPSGEATLNFRGPHEFVPGAYYYLDMEPDETGTWTYSSLTRFPTNGEVVLNLYCQSPNPGLQYGTLKMNITRLGTLQLFGEVGTRLNVTFTKAPL